MKKLDTVRTLWIAVLVGAVFTLLPANTAWAGRAAQTVPTEGPSPTPSTPAPLPTSTRMPAQTAVPSATSPSAADNPVVDTETPAPGITLPAVTATVAASAATASSIQALTSTVSPSKSVSKETVTVPTVVSARENGEQGSPAGQNQPRQGTTQDVKAPSYLLYGCLLFSLLILLAAGFALSRRRTANKG